MTNPPLRSPLRYRVGPQLLRLLWRPAELHLVAGVSCSGKTTFIETNLLASDKPYVVGIRAYPAQVPARRRPTIVHWDLFNGSPDDLPVNHPCWLLVRAARSLHVTLIAPSQPTLLYRLAKRAQLLSDGNDFFSSRYRHYADSTRLADTYIKAVRRIEGLPVSRIQLTDGDSVELLSSLDDAKSRLTTIYSPENAAGYPQ